MTIKDRLKQYIKFKGISTREFCREIGVSETYVSSMRSSIQPDKMKLIISKFPDLSMQWLFTGEGDMITESKLLPPIDKDVFVATSSEVFKDKLIDMFKKGEIFSATVVWEQHRMLIEQTNKVEMLQKEVERLKLKLVCNGIDPM